MTHANNPDSVGLPVRMEQLLAEARAYIAELKQQLFGPKADKLTPEQEECPEVVAMKMASFRSTMLV